MLLFVSLGAKFSVPLVLTKSPGATADPLAVAKLTDTARAGGGDTLTVNAAFAVPALPSNKLTSLMEMVGVCTAVIATAVLFARYASASARETVV